MIVIDRRVSIEHDTKGLRDEKVKDFIQEEKLNQDRIKTAREAVVTLDEGDGTDLEPVPDEDTATAINLHESAKNNGEVGAMTESEEASELRVAFDEKRAEWKKRRDGRGGKAADKEFNDALRQEKRISEQRTKAETNCAVQLEKFCLRQAPLGMDRHRNKYWWFACDAATLYVEPPMPPSGQAQPDPSSYSFEWRMWCGSEAMKQLADSLCEQGVRECELKAGIQKIIEKLGAEDQQSQSKVRAQLKMKQPDDRLFLLSFQFALQEARNIKEVLTTEQLQTLSHELPDWQKIIETPFDCNQMSKLLQHLEHAVHESLSHTKRTNQREAASRARADAPGAEASAQNGIEGPIAGGSAHDLPEEWQNDNIYVNQRVRRDVLDDKGNHAGKANGTVVGYLPKEKADFKSKQTNLDAALWKVKFDDPDLVGSEDLEEYEVIQAINDYKKMVDSSKSAASLRKGVAPTRPADSSSVDVGGSELVYDEGAIDMAEASNKVTGALWTRCLPFLPSSEIPASWCFLFCDKKFEFFFPHFNLVYLKVRLATWALTHTFFSLLSYTYLFFSVVLWVFLCSAMQREAWRREVESAALSNSVVRVCYSASVLCENVLRVMGKTRNDLTTAPRRTRTERGKRPRDVTDVAMFTSVFQNTVTDGGRRVKRVNYAENGNNDSDDSD